MCYCRCLGFRAHDPLLKRVHSRQNFGPQTRNHFPVNFVVSGIKLISLILCDKDVNSYVIVLIV